MLDCLKGGAIWWSIFSQVFCSIDETHSQKSEVDIGLFLKHVDLSGVTRCGSDLFELRSGESVLVRLSSNTLTLKEADFQLTRKQAKQLKDRIVGIIEKREREEKVAMFNDAISEITKEQTLEIFRR